MSEQETRYNCRRCDWGGWTPIVEKKGDPPLLTAYCPRCGGYLKHVSSADAEAIARVQR